MEKKSKGPSGGNAGAGNEKVHGGLDSNSGREGGPGLTRLPDALAPLTGLPHWVLWRYEVVKGKRTKVPYQVNGKKAKTDDPSTWASFEAAAAAAIKFDGTGFCLSGSGLAAFDVDDCRDPSSGELDPWAQALVERCGSYPEVTPSGTGIRIIGRGEGEEVHRKLKVPGTPVTCEVYRKATRYITVTGNALGDRPLVNIDEQIDAVVAELDQKKKSGRAGRASASGSTGKKGLPQDLRIMLHLTGDAPAGYQSRSELFWAFLCKAARLGTSDEDVVAACLDQARAGCSIHQHVGENGGEGYVERQIEKAREQTPTLRRDANGRPIGGSQENVVAALDMLGIKLRHDVFADRMTISGLDGHDLLDDAAVKKLWLMIDGQFHLRPSFDFFWTVVQVLAWQNAHHPVLDYLDGLKWDGVERIDKWLVTYGGAADTKYARAVSALSLIAAVRRVRTPGCKFDEMVIFESPQGKLKSQALEIMAVREDWFSDDLPLGADSKRMIEHLKGRWIIEAAELSGMRKAEVGQLKSFLSRRVDRARMSYDRTTTEQLRQCVVFGSTNDREYLKDQTGNRRYWPVALDTFDVEQLRRDRDQLWAEAVVREARGDSIRLDPKLWPSAQREQKQRTIEEPWVEVIAGVLGDMKGKLLNADAWAIVGLLPAQRTQEHNRRLGEAMHALGWERKHARFAGKYKHGYVSGKKPWKQIIVKTSSENGMAYAEYGDRKIF